MARYECPKCGNELEYVDSPVIDAFYEEHIYVCNRCKKKYRITRHVEGEIITGTAHWSQSIEEIKE
ncbi:MAG: hypothetical protein ACTSUO_05995 [Candidatus Thorarchaeota archaeon]